MTGDERLAKVAEVQEQHAYCRSRTDGDTTTWECGIVTSGGFPHFPAMQRVHVTQALAPLLDEFRAKDEAGGLREAISVMDSLPNHNDLYHMHLNSLAAGRAEAWDEGAHAATQDYGIGVAENPYRAALAAAEPDAGER